MFGLVPHPNTPARAVSEVRVRLRIDGDTLFLTFVVTGNEHVALPDWVSSARADGLWRTTCCELFLAPAKGDGYFEFNYSPSTEWAAYRFSSYRAGGQDMPLSITPHVHRGDEDSPYLVDVDQYLGNLPAGVLCMGLSAVIEEVDGTKSYWALAHAPGPPDFHNPAGFTATLRR